MLDQARIAYTALATFVVTGLMVIGLALAWPQRGPAPKTANPKPQPSSAPLGPPRQLRVGSDAPFRSLQAALAEATPYSVISVRGMAYLTESITLEGPQHQGVEIRLDQATLDSGLDTALSIRNVSDVTIRGGEIISTGPKPAVVLQGELTGLQIAGLRIERPAGEGPAVSVLNARGSLDRPIVLREMVVSGSVGVRLHAEGETTSNLFLTDSLIQGVPPEAGPLLDVSGPTTNVLIDNSRFHDAAVGVRIQAQESPGNLQLLLENNTFSALETAIDFGDVDGEQPILVRRCLFLQSQTLRGAALPAATWFDDNIWEQRPESVPESVADSLPNVRVQTRDVNREGFLFGKDDRLQRGQGQVGAAAP